MAILDPCLENISHATDNNKQSIWDIPGSIEIIQYHRFQYLQAAELWDQSSSYLKMTINQYRKLSLLGS